MSHQHSGRELSWPLPFPSLGASSPSFPEWTQDIAPGRIDSPPGPRHIAQVSMTRQQPMQIDCRYLQVPLKSVRVMMSVRSWAGRATCRQPLSTDGEATTPRWCLHNHVVVGACGGSPTALFHYVASLLYNLKQKPTSLHPDHQCVYEVENPD